MGTTLVVAQHMRATYRGTFEKAWDIFFFYPVTIVDMFHVSTCPTCTCFMFLRALRALRVHVSCFYVSYVDMFRVSACSTCTCFYVVYVYLLHMFTCPTYFCRRFLRALHVPARLRHHRGCVPYQRRLPAVDHRRLQHAGSRDHWLGLRPAVG